MPPARQICLQLVSTIGLVAMVSCTDRSDKLAYHVQLVRASNEVQPPEPARAVIGPKLAQHLRPVFSWTNYWEIARQQVFVSSGQKAKLRLSPQREVEIDLTTGGKRTVVAFSNDEVVSRVTRPLGDSMTIIGGDRDRQTAWFIIVRRDKPSN